MSKRRTPVHPATRGEYSDTCTVFADTAREMAMMLLRAADAWDTARAHEEDLGVWTLAADFEHQVVAQVRDLASTRSRRIGERTRARRSRR